MFLEQFLYKKAVDWSVLNLGINIPLSLQAKFYENLSIGLARGQTRKIKIWIESQEYIVKLANIYFDINKYPNHKDLLQIRYSPSSPVAQKIREIFSNSFIYISKEKSKFENTRKRVFVPESCREYIVLYATQFQDTYVVDCITINELKNIKENIATVQEYELEQLLEHEGANSAIIEKLQLKKIRKLDANIGKRLKLLYGYRCQVCGKYIGEKYGSTIIHAHYIEPFSTSLDNTPQNIMILCPNHHSIVHDVLPKFNVSNMSYEYQNGYIEPLKLNLHL